MNGYSKFFFHGTNDFFCQLDYFTSGSSSQIHQHQCLLVMYSGISQPFALPSATVNHPSCRNFYTVVTYFIKRHIRIFLEQIFELCKRYNRIHKETAGISNLFRCGEVYDADKTTRYDCVLAEARESDESDDIILLDNDEVDVEELARDAFILDMDTKFLCSEDCRGLCPGCGVNLNRENCRCKKAVDPRLAKLAQLLQKDE